jgi:DNA-3-methyladenine glycosylase
LSSSIQAFFARPSEQVAPELLGSSVTLGAVTVELTEVEAYDGTSDPASHAFRGPTPRNEVMFGPSGRVYVYFIYGMHWAVNLVCRSEGDASAVLLRAGRVTHGEAEARVRRGDVPHHQLARGPGNLSAALGATGALTGTTLWDGPMRWSPAPHGTAAYMVGPRVGVTGAADTPWRMWLAGDPTVSAYRRSKRA